MAHCSLCCRKFDKIHLLESVHDEFFCKECFTRKFLATKKKNCTTKCEGDSLGQPKRMFSVGELSTIKRDRDRKSGFYTSKKPLQCPHKDCNKYVSVFDLITHYRHEHREVPIVRTALDTRNPLTFHPKDVRYGEMRCLVLLSVAPQFEDGAQGEKWIQIPVSVAVLASRISASYLIDDTEESPPEDDGSISLSVGTSDKIILWTASNVVCNYNSTVAVSTDAEDVRVKYYGPVLQLGDSPVKLCKEGQCLILTHFSFEGMSNNGLDPVKLDVIVHSED